MVKRISLILLSLVLLLGLGLAACAAPEPAPAPTPAPTPTPAPAESALDKIIEAAKQEGEVNFLCTTGYTPEELQQGIKDKFGVDVKVTVSTTRQTQALANAIMEIKSGATPQIDVMHMSAGNYLGTAKPEGAVAEIDWKSLMTDDINPDFYIPPPADFMSPWGYVQMVAYNPEKSNLAELPNTRQGFTDPKWKGKFAWISYGSANAEINYYMGLSEEEGLKFVSDLVANGAVMASFQEAQDRLMLGEIVFALGSSTHYNKILIENPNSPLKWVPLKDFVLVNEHADFVLKNSKNQNAAILLVLYLASPEGQTLGKKYGVYKQADPDPKSTEYKMVEEAKKAGVKVVYPSRDKDYNEWCLTQEYKDYLKKIGVAIKGGQSGGK